MNVLWLCNIILPQIAENLNLPYPNTGGWLTGTLNDLVQNKDLKLSIAFPIYHSKKNISGKVGNIEYFGFAIGKGKLTQYNPKIVEYFKNIIRISRPDIIHIFGTEFPHTLSMVKASCPGKTVISIQGLVSYYSKHYYANLPINILKRYTIRDFIKRDNIIMQKRKLEKRGLYEIEAIKRSQYVIGRTDWDYTCTYQINSKIKYYYCNEILRDIFYEKRWELEKCRPYSIFVSQGHYPIKGLHHIIEALVIIKKDFPNTHLNIAGKNIIDSKTYKDKLKISSYGKYILKLIKKNNLYNDITFLGDLNELDICRQYLSTHVFVSPSSIENSPNSIGEALLLGVPVIASDVGGTKNLLVHDKEGYIYQSDAPYMIAYYISKIFNNNKIALSFSIKGREHALELYSKENNISCLLKIYNELSKDR